MVLGGRAQPARAHSANYVWVEDQDARCGSTQPIDFSAVDDVAVDIVFMLLSPPEAGAEHLKALARVSRLLRDRTTVAKLRGAGSPDAIYALLTADDARDAA